MNTVAIAEIFFFVEFNRFPSRTGGGKRPAGVPTPSSHFACVNSTSRRAGRL
jgi:hypothetical protein